MQRRAINVVKEYVAHASPSVRENVATALAAIGDQESVTTLVEIALSDGDPAVRDHAAAELASLDEPAARSADEILVRMLREAPAERAQAVYKLLGRMRLHGSKFRVRWASLRLRFLLIKSLKTLAEPANYRSPWRDIGSGLQGSVITGVLLGLYLAATLKIPLNSAIFNMLVFASPFIAVCLAVAAARRVNPIALQFDRPAAVAVEAWTTSLPSMLLAIAFCFIVFLIAADSDNADPLAGRRMVAVLIATPIMIGVFVAAVRVGTMMAAGVVRSAFGLRIFPVLVGACAGMLVAIGAATMAHLVHSPASVDTILQQTWLLLLPSAGGLANAFARIDREVPSKEPMAGGRLVSTLVITALAVALLLPVAALVRFRLGHLGGQPAMTARDAAAPGKQLVVQVNAGRGERFAINFKQDVNVILPNCSDGKGDCKTVGITRADNEISEGLASLTGKEQKTLKFSKTGSARLRPGFYAISVVREETSMDTALSGLAKLVPALWGGTKGEMMSLALNSHLEGPLQEFRDGEPQEISGFWKFDTVPSERRFRLNRDHSVELEEREESELQDDGRGVRYVEPDIDFVVEIYQGDKRLAIKDDPPSLTISLSDGEYRAVVRLAGERLDTKQLRRLPKAFTLDLRIR